MPRSASDLARALALSAEAVCRRYLSNGCREGNYWMVGDVHNAHGRSLYVRLEGHGGDSGSPGKWRDAQSGEHGDLLDIIAAACGHHAFGDTMDEARRFLSLPQEPVRVPRTLRPSRGAVPGSPERAGRLWAGSRPIAASPATRYLASRGITDLAGVESLRFHRACYYRAGRDDAPDVPRIWPAMIAAVTDGQGALTGVHRTWLQQDMTGKAPVATPRRAMGHLLGHGVRFGDAGPVMAAGEGIETMFSLRQAMPCMPMIAALSAAHLAALEFPCCLKRLYVACDADAAGDNAFASLSARAGEQGIEALPLRPRLDDFSSDLMAMGLEALKAALISQLGLIDAAGYLQNR
ncbi:DUF7146 domain-containing protein [Blastomonas fulva]|uniref:DUF7146 domain-containing protein n=1 Tax=Blastomonas fulva TaxID=1550728 RepID=UPI003F6F56FE